MRQSYSTQTRKLSNTPLLSRRFERKNLEEILQPRTERKWSSSSTQYVRPCSAILLYFVIPILNPDDANHCSPFQISSFRQKSLEEKFGARNPLAPMAWEKMMLQYAALSPAPAHPVTGKVLCFENGKQMKKSCYIKLVQDYECTSNALKPFFGRDQAGGLVLTEESLKELEAAQRERLAPPKPVQSNPAHGYVSPSLAPYTQSPTPTPIAAPTAGVYDNNGYWYPQGYQYEQQTAYPYGYNYNWQGYYQYPAQSQLPPQNWQVRS